MHTYYENLKVSRTAPPEVIRAAYKSLAQKYHPDRNANDVDAARIMKLINEAYEVLSDPLKRAEHDRWIARQEEINKELQQHVQQKQTAQSQRPIFSASVEPAKKNRDWGGWFALTIVIGVIGIFAASDFGMKKIEESGIEDSTDVAAAVSEAVAAAEFTEGDVIMAANDASNSGYDTYLPVQPLPNTGDTDNSNIYGVAPLQIQTPYDGDHYFVKIEDAYTQIHLVSYFIRSGDTLNVDLPLGSYTIKYAYGKQWYGADHLFGKNTGYAKAEQVFTFQSDGYQYNGYTVELIKQVNGNLHTSSISAEQF